MDAVCLNLLHFFMVEAIIVQIVIVNLVVFTAILIEATDIIGNF